MFGSVVTALLRAVLDEAGVDVPTPKARKKAVVVSNAVEGAPKGDLNVENSRTAGRQAFLAAPSMWN
jgi:RIO-like serine/threonine protein kinase